MSQTISIIVKPGADAEHLDALRASVSSLRQAGHSVEVRQTFEAGDGERFAREAAGASVDLVVAAGGDGTINEVVNGLGVSSRRPRFAVVPLGTANDFALGLGVPPDVEAAVRAAVSGHARAVDLPIVNQRYFLNVSTGGFGAEATEQAVAESKRLLGSWAYLITGARQFVDLAPVGGLVEADGRIVFSGEFLLFAVGNGRQTGGGSILTPRAELNDGLLDLLIVRTVQRLDFLSMLPDLRAGTHLESPDILYTQAAHLVITTEETLSVNADGEPIRGTRFEYRLDPERLVVMTP
ncbi:MAG TPA: YegS/Rv2252/BmrU family lipid kinase [Longimicrobiales bacterium]|nr:YegS/Rv2252/BmrU family lipid kinase [Longimicrobiales bacterium]